MLDPFSCDEAESIAQGAFQPLFLLFLLRLDMVVRQITCILTVIQGYGVPSFGELFHSKRCFPTRFNTARRMADKVSFIFTKLNFFMFLFVLQFGIPCVSCMNFFLCGYHCHLFGYLYECTALAVMDFLSIWVSHTNLALRRTVCLNLTFYQAQLCAVQIA
jgi:hypothetical protein